MSLILDALRKSEAERRRGQAPTLYSALPAPASRAYPGWLRIAPWVAAGVLLLVALFVYLDRSGPATKSELEEAAAGGVAEPGPLAGDVATGLAAPPPAAPPPAAAIVPAPAAPADARAAPGVDALVPPPRAALAAPAPFGHPPVPAPATAPAEPAAPAEEALPPIAVLEPSSRSALPPMKLSMHVYDSEPARRFAIIDGQRVTEGAQLGAAVVTEIRRDGVVLDVGGRRVLLPRP
jgi:general secretion pathway protein B